MERLIILIKLISVQKEPKRVTISLCNFAQNQQDLPVKRLVIHKKQLGLNQKRTIRYVICIVAQRDNICTISWIMTPFYGINTSFQLYIDLNLEP